MEVTASLCNSTRHISSLKGLLEKNMLLCYEAFNIAKTKSITYWHCGKSTNVVWHVSTLTMSQWFPLCGRRLDCRLIDFQGFLKLKKFSILKGVANAFVTKTYSGYISRNTAFDCRKNVCIHSLQVSLESKFFIQNCRGPCKNFEFHVVAAVFK